MGVWTEHDGVGVPNAVVALAAGSSVTIRLSVKEEETENHELVRTDYDFITGQDDDEYWCWDNNYFDITDYKIV